MQKISAGLLDYRRNAGVLEVLLTHPGGPLWTRRDEGAWMIPKGEVNPGEDLLDAARREFHEETGFQAEGTFLAIAPIRQKAGKVVHCWAFEGDFDPAQIRSNDFEMEWPPHSGKIVRFPEVDRAQWFDLTQARKKMLPSQLPLLDELERSL